jgi:hypothetical protein
MAGLTRGPSQPRHVQTNSAATGSAEIIRTRPYRLEYNAQNSLRVKLPQHSDSSKCYSETFYSGDW